MKSKKWFVLFPGDTYALSKEFEEPVDEQQVRKWAKQWEGVRRLPRGFECWIAEESKFW